MAKRLDCDLPGEKAFGFASFGKNYLVFVKNEMIILDSVVFFKY